MKYNSRPDVLALTKLTQRNASSKCECS